MQAAYRQARFPENTGQARAGASAVLSALARASWFDPTSALIALLAGLELGERLARRAARAAGELERARA